jgi:hypothetical protein
MMPYSSSMTSLPPRVPARPVPVREHLGAGADLLCPCRGSRGPARGELWGFVGILARAGAAYVMAFSLFLQRCR